MMKIILDDTDIKEFSNLISEEIYNRFQNSGQYSLLSKIKDSLQQLIVSKLKKYSKEDNEKINLS